MTFGRLIPVSLRLSTLGLRFVLIFLLARYLPISDVGLYGLFTATVSYVLYPLGFDFYTYATRQIMRGDRARWRVFVTSQMAFAACLFVVMMPMLVGLFAAGLLPWSLVGWFFVILPLEYLGLEIDRLLIAMSDQVGASVVLFVGGALNPLTAIPLLWAAPTLRHLSTVLATWAAYDVVALGVGSSLVMRATTGADRPTIDWNWVRVGVRASLPFLAGTVCLRALFTVDREVVKVFSDLSVLGAYTFYMSIGAGMTSVLYSGVQQFAYPHLVRSAHERDLVSFQRHLRSLFRQTLGGVIGISILALAAEPLILRFVRDDVYQEYSWMLPISLVVVGVYNLSVVPHYALYALDADRTILRITATSLVAFAAVIAIFARVSVVGSVLAGIGAASTVLVAGKTWSYLVRRRRTLLAPPRERVTG
jgi:O-antigen/teichoic acid export membrane protein